MMQMNIYVQKAFEIWRIFGRTYIFKFDVVMDNAIHVDVLEALQEVLHVRLKLFIVVYRCVFLCNH